MEGTSSETRNLHAWSDKRHLFTKQRKKKENNPLHPSLEAALTLFGMYPYVSYFNSYLIVGRSSSLF
jgi:hypothetical protein